MDWLMWSKYQFTQSMTLGMRLKTAYYAINNASYEIIELLIKAVYDQVRCTCDDVYHILCGMQIYRKIYKIILDWLSNSKNAKSFFHENIKISFN